MDLKDIQSRLIKKGLLSCSDCEIIPLKGGISSDIYLVKDGKNQWVVKKALSRLRVKDEWKADISRNQVEQDFIRFVQRIFPFTVPEIIFSDPAGGYFVMEYLDPSFDNWKNQLMKGNFQRKTAQKAALLLAGFHSSSWENQEARRQFDTSSNFWSLRIEPYLITTGNRNPELKSLFRTEAERLLNYQQVLVHGDFSPKNIMVSKNRMVLLDHEVAWYGDPAFDLAFMLTHLHLKQLVHHQSGKTLPDLPRIFWDTYFENLSPEPGDMEERIGRLWLMILLARIDGKSPVEYLEGKDREKEFIRSFVYDALKEGNFIRNDLAQMWKLRLTKFSDHENRSG